jgi:hypothetical protein
VASFRAAFPDVRLETVALVGEGDIVDWWGVEDNDDRRRQLRGPGPAPSRPGSATPSAGST